ncbi:glycoside hydrolase family 6 protein [Glycomyces xiaoerkulensis]|uniref:glycoside hydrolase family 6 protein n=1 Tax=Glycomyces xiaoerkulensis TaxID=2038139 RepID=UPI000C2671ED|nr:glycoside hydrolase family 6 protein [Glycomyces xiaoerkulensis]
MKRKRRLTAIAAAAGAAAVAGATAIALAPGASAQGEALWTNPSTQAADWVAQNPGDWRADLIDERIAQTPAGTWFAEHNPGEVQGQVADIVSQSGGEAPIMVVYNIPDRDCGGASSGGAPSHSAYRDWIDQFAAGLSGAAYIVVEPDTLPHECADPSQRNQSLTYAVQTLKAASSQAHVYLDVGHSAWLSPGEAASRLQSAGLQSADGFALNTSNYRSTDEAVGYAHDIQNIVGSDKAAVIDTSRNGNGPAPDDEWCDPSGRAIGEHPTTNTGVNGIDAYLWTKLPGEADGCAGSAGQFIADLAYELADAAGPDWPGDVDDPPTSDDPTSDDPTSDDPTSDDPTSDDPTTDPPNTGDGDCSAEIEVVNDWGSGWQGDVRVTAGDAAIDGWTLTWTWPGGQSISSSWNADINESGSSVTASDIGWNGSIAAGQTTNAFGFIGSGSSATPAVECSA